MRVIAAILGTTVLASCATTSGEGRGDHEMAVLAEGALFVGGAAAATYGCASNWDECRTEAPPVAGITAAVVAVLAGMIYAQNRYEHYLDGTVNVHVDAPPRPGDVAFAFTMSEHASEPRIGERNYGEIVLIDPVKHGADLSVSRRGRVCVAYATAVDAPLDEIHCRWARPFLPQ